MDMFQRSGNHRNQKGYGITGTSPMEPANTNLPQEKSCTRRHVVTERYSLKCSIVFIGLPWFIMWFTHGFTMVLPWSYHGLPWFTYHFSASFSLLPRVTSGRRRSFPRPQAAGSVTDEFLDEKKMKKCLGCLGPQKNKWCSFDHPVLFFNTQ